MSIRERIEDLFLDYFPLALFASLGLLIVGIGFAIYEDATAERFSLRKDSWSCERSHTEHTWTGKMYVTTTVCDRWDRNK